MDVRVRSVRESVRVDEMGNMTRTRIVIYTVGEHGPFQLEIPAAEFNAATVQQRVEETAREVRALFPPG